MLVAGDGAVLPEAANLLRSIRAVATLRGPVLHQLREFAVVADCVRVVAEVAHHLDQSLLGGGAG